jgi:hypothetical protein
MKLSKAVGSTPLLPPLLPAGGVRVAVADKVAPPARLAFARPPPVGPALERTALLFFVVPAFARGGALSTGALGVLGEPAAAAGFAACGVGVRTRSVGKAVSAAEAPLRADGPGGSLSALMRIV